MRLYEIDDSDKIWAKINGLDLDIDKEFNNITDILDILIRLKSPYRNTQLLPAVGEFCKTLNTILNTEFADDNSTKELKNKAKEMLSDIGNRKQQL